MGAAKKVNPKSKSNLVLFKKVNLAIEISPKN